MMYVNKGKAIGEKIDKISDIRIVDKQNLSLDTSQWRKEMRV